MSEDDDAAAAEASLRKAVEQLSGNGAGDDSQAPHVPVAGRRAAGVGVLGGFIGF
ncbi:hypothetical protein ACIGXF_38895 [Streptomyces sp. NPDC053086]|uniref:hypothetical protein n=1 Tax=unclassified Streptomyces TaxID=2593676 RepID=UPI0037D6A268